MIRKALPLLLLVAFSLLVADFVNPAGSCLFGSPDRNTEGSLAFSVRTATYNGQYGPRNAGVIWVTNAQNQFVKTIKVWANQYRYTLVRWIASSSQNTTGATTGASLNNHQLHNVTWNGKNYQNVEVPDGEYKINVEFTEHNASASNMGKYKQVTFTKGPNPVDQDFPNETYFKDMSLTWTPVIVNGAITGTVYGAQELPVGGATVQAGSFSVSSSANGSYNIVVPPGTYTLSCSAAGYQIQDIFDVVVSSGQTVIQDFHLDTVSADDPHNAAPGLLMEAMYPNPFVFSSSCKVHSPGAKSMRLEVFNARGLKVYASDLSSPTKGWREIIWNGQDASGKRCANGVYTVVLSQGQDRASRKVTLRY